MLHAPEGEPRLAALFCHPAFDEKKSGHRALVSCARRMALAGAACLRMDLRGCGDSDLDHGEASLKMWDEDVSEAISFLGERFPGTALGLLGLRLGASLAARAAEKHLANDAAPRILVLWEPVLCGRVHLEEQLKRKQLREMLTCGRASTQGRGHLSTGSAGPLDLDGFLVSPLLREELMAFNLDRPRSFRGEVFILQISASDSISPAISALAENYKKAGSNVRSEALREAPFWNQLDPVECPTAVDRTLEWLESLPLLKSR